MSQALTGIGGAASGAALGTAVAPGIGTAIGAVAGGVAGFFSKSKAGISGEDYVAGQKEIANANIIIAGIDSKNKKRKTEITLAITVGVILLAGSAVILLWGKK